MCVLAVVESGATPKFSYLTCQEKETEWKRVNPQGEEFSILTPVAPTLLKQASDYISSGTEERILAHHSYGGYAGDFIFYIESYKAARPQKLLKAVSGNSYQQKVFESEITINGFKGKQYRLDSRNFHGKALSFVTKQHLYLITLASMDATSASIERFISALMLGENINAPATGQVLDVRDSPHYKSALLDEPETTQSQEEVFNPRVVSRKAVIVSRPEPVYTEAARQNRVTGTVVVRGVLGADGQVKNLKVTRGLEHGLSGKAVEAALALRFFPAEKDGQLVSQFVHIEYNFNMY
jgi:TonB family protein